MASAGGGGGLVFLDACCLINLFATGRAEEILRTLPYDFAVARYVAEEEILEIEPAGRGTPGEGPRARESLRPSIQSLTSIGILQEIDVESSTEIEALIHFASRLDDGEAHTLALALTRDARLATDDKKALRVFQQHSPSPCLRTTDLLFQWAGLQEIQAPDLAQIIRSITRRACFLPPKSDSYFERWMELLQKTRR